MLKREVIRCVLEGDRPPYVPWSCGFTKEAKARLQAYYGQEDIETPLQNHILKLGSDIGFFTDLGNERVRDVFGVVWDRSIDKDIGNVEAASCASPASKGTTSRTRSTRACSRISRAASANTATGSAFTSSVFRFTSAPGPCAVWSTC